MVFKLNSGVCNHMLSKVEDANFYREATERSYLSLY